MKKAAFLFAILWLALNLVQGNFTELTSDEGYYWFYSTSLSWGYYDHPPFLAWMIAAGYALFRTELGVRLFNILMNAGAIFLFFRLISPYVKDNRVPVLLLLSMPLLTYIAFIVFPDGPLVFFSLLFLIAYKKFLTRADAGTAALLGTTVALMLYSKYHGILVVVFTVLSNPSLLRSKYFYLSGLTALVLFLPHLWWQQVHHYATLRYHLQGRLSSFSFNHVFEYVSQQIVAIGPALIFVPFVYKTTDQFEKTLKYIILGTFAFFLFSSLKAFVHFHWTSITIFPLLFLAVRYYSVGSRRKLLAWLSAPFIAFLFVMRVQLMYPFLPFNHVNVDYYAGRKLWAQDISKLAAGSPVLFRENFREAGLYSFYAKSTAATFFPGNSRKSQYDIWHYEDSLQHKDVLYVQDDSFPLARKLTTRMGKNIYYATLADFSSYYNVGIEANCIPPAHNDDSVQMMISITNPRQQLLEFRQDAQGGQPVLFYHIEKNRALVQKGMLKTFSPGDSLLPGQSNSIRLKIPINNLAAGSYKIVLGFHTGSLPDSRSEEVSVEII